MFDWESDSDRRVFPWFQRLESLKHLTLHVPLFGRCHGDTKYNLNYLLKIVQNLPQYSRTRLQTIKLVSSPSVKSPQARADLSLATALFDPLSRSIEKFQVLESLDIEWRLFNIKNSHQHAEALIAEVTSCVKEGMSRLDARGLLRFSTSNVLCG